MPFLDTGQLKKRYDALSKLEEKLSFRIARLAKLLEAHAVRTLNEAPLSLTGYRIIMSVELFEETCAADLSHVLLIDRAQISRSVSDLLAQGYLLTRADPTSKRRKLLRLSKSGSQLLDNLKSPFALRQARFIEVIGEEERVALEAAISKLTEYLSQELDRSTDGTQSD